MSWGTSAVLRAELASDEDSHLVTCRLEASYDGRQVCRAIFSLNQTHRIAQIGNECGDMRHESGLKLDGQKCHCAHQFGRRRFHHDFLVVDREQIAAGSGAFFFQSLYHLAQVALGNHLVKEHDSHCTFSYQSENHGGCARPPLGIWISRHLL